MEDASAIADEEHGGEGGGEGEVAGDDATCSSTVIHLSSVSKWVTPREVKHHLSSALSITGIRSVKKQHKHDYCFVHFESVACRDAAITALDGHVWKGRAVQARPARALDPGRFMKRRLDETDGGGSSAAPDAKRPAGPDGAPSSEAPEPTRSAADAVAPLYAMPYADQLELKRRNMLKALRKLPVAMGRAAKGAAKGGEQTASQAAEWKDAAWLQPAHLKAHEWGPCPLAQVSPSPVVHGYRNKCEFSYGRDAEGRPVIGFQLGRSRLGNHLVGEPSGCPNVPPEMLALVAAAQASLDGSSLPPYDKMSGEGFWRQLLVRQAFGGSGEPALLAVVAVQSAGAPADIVSSELDALTAALRKSSSRLSVAAQTSDGRGEVTAEGAPTRSLLGEPWLEEHLLGLRFRISPAAFFQATSWGFCAPAVPPRRHSRPLVQPRRGASQVNTGGAETLVSLLRAQCGLTPRTTLLDVCCGTGTLGLALASSVHRVVGIEINADAVDDARRNAELNGVANAQASPPRPRGAPPVAFATDAAPTWQFVCGKAEAQIRGVLSAIPPDADVVAVVDPPRAGLHKDVLKARAQPMAAAGGHTRYAASLTETAARVAGAARVPSDLPAGVRLVPRALVRRQRGLSVPAALGQLRRHAVRSVARVARRPLPSHGAVRAGGAPGEGRGRGAHRGRRRRGDRGELSCVWE